MCLSLYKVTLNINNACWTGLYWLGYHQPASSGTHYRICNNILSKARYSIQRENQRTSTEQNVLMHASEHP
jgi:hypothetical protein